MGGLVVLEFVFYVLVWWYIYGEAKEFRALGSERYLASGWNVIDCINLALFVAVMALRVQHLRLAFALAPELASTERYLGEFTHLADTAKLVDELNAFNAALSFVKVFKYLRYQPLFGQYIDTVTHTASSTIGVMIVIANIITA